MATTKRGGWKRFFTLKRRTKTWLSLGALSLVSATVGVFGWKGAVTATQKLALARLALDRPPDEPELHAEESVTPLGPPPTAGPTQGPPSEVLRAERLLHKQKYDEAMKHLERVLARDPNNARAMRDVCIAYDHMGRENEAARACRRAIRLDESDVSARRNLARIYYDGGAYKWAAAEWRHILERYPHDVEARRGLRQVELKLRKRA
jgi:Flp pilus assembly protein TadD